MVPLYVSKGRIWRFLERVGVDEFAFVVCFTRKRSVERNKRALKRRKLKTIVRDDFERVVVGRAKYNSAQEGLTAVSDYVWGKSAALLRVEPNPDPLMTETFGYTYRFGGKAYRNEVIPDRLGGAMGGQYIKLSTFEDDVVIGGANTGYLLTTVIS